MTGADKNSRELAAVILAAGYSSRMKAFKPLLTIGGMTALERLVGSIRAAGVEKIIVVTGHGRERLQPLLDKLNLRSVYNRSFDKGMFTSIQAGLSAAERFFSGISGTLLMPVDCPLIGSKALESVIKATESAACENLFHVPVFRGKKGHPLFIPAVYIEEICSYEGSGGLKAITDKYWDRMVRVPVDDEGCVMDMDTQEGYEELKEFWEAGCIRTPLEVLSRGKRIILLRHGQTQQHEEKMFIGQYDVPLSPEGRTEFACTAREIAGSITDADTIYCSDLVRASESAVILAESLKEKNGKTPYIKELRQLREIALGDWDGKPIRLIRERFPQEYRRRGHEIFSFKTGNRSENFYDMQYRAVKALRRILEEDSCKDIVIVAHSGVIRALENNLRGLGVEDRWDRIPKAGFRIIDMR